MTTLVAAAAIVFFIAVLVTLSRSGTAAAIGSAPLGTDKVSLFGRPEQLQDNDRHRSQADLGVSSELASVADRSAR